MKDVRRCPTLPHPPECSTIGAGGLSFRVRNETGRFPSAITTETVISDTTHYPYTHTVCLSFLGGPWPGLPAGFVPEKGGECFGVVVCCESHSGRVEHKILGG